SLKMAIDWDAVEELQGDAEGQRKRGDRLRKDGDEAGARAAFEIAEARLRKCLKVLEETPTSETAVARAETLGSLAGILRRTTRNEEAFELYSKGAEVERQYR